MTVVAPTTTTFQDLDWTLRDVGAPVNSCMPLATRVPAHRSPKVERVWKPKIADHKSILQLWCHPEWG